MQITTFNIAETGKFSKLIQDYLAGNPTLAEHYNRTPDLSEFSGQMEERAQQPIQRKALLKALQQQYKGAAFIPEEAIDKLLQNNTFTITTGHQLTLFGGPLYFYYKIEQVIQMAAFLDRYFDHQHFVPVFWMASEDHDFEEINHVHIKGKQLRYQAQSGGPVGRLDTAPIAQLQKELETLLGPGKNAQALVQMFEKSYCAGTSLAAATRSLVHQLFPDVQLIVLDGDDPQLKKLAVPLFQKELDAQLVHAHATPLSQKLEETYFSQAHIREINLFYLTNNERGRLVKTDAGFAVDGTHQTFTAAALQRELQQHPERFSPNVLLRPLYQETILPNLAYLGGAGELAYWLQLKSVFAAAQVVLPILWLRHSFLFIPKRIHRKMQKLQLELADLWKPKKLLEQELIAAATQLELQLDPYRQKLETMFEELRAVAALTDKSMLGAVAAQQTKQLNGIEKLEAKLLRAEKRKHAHLLAQLDEIWDWCYPNGSMQERYDHFATLDLEMGPDWRKEVFDTPPFLNKFYVVVETD